MKKVLIIVGLLVVTAAAALALWIGPRNVVGALTYGRQARDGDLQVGERADFLTIYIKEAHPEDERQMDVNEDQGVCYKQPTTLEQRVAIASDFAERGVVAYKGRKGPFGFDSDELEGWLDQRFQ